MKKNIIITENQLKRLIELRNVEKAGVLNEDKYVESIQKALIDKGYDVGPDGVDGVFGKNTKAAVLKFQKDNSINQTGFVGKLTRAALGITGTPTPKTDDKVGGDSLLSTNIDTNFQNKFILPKLSTKDSMYVCSAGQENCGQFVNDFSKKIDFVGNAWLAHDLDGVGKRVWTVYQNLDPKTVDEIYKIFVDIDKAGGWKDDKNGPITARIKALNEKLTKNQINPSILKVDDVVGIYYPPSSHHQQAFYEAGKPYFVKDEKGNITKGKTISSGKGFGMNTHVGIVGAIKNGVPLIFHNIGGMVYSDPFNKLKGGGKIAWVKRK